jgi:hypothetical protein
MSAVTYLSHIRTFPVTGPSQSPPGLVTGVCHSQGRMIDDV